MGTRGRRSIAELSIVNGGHAAVAHKRPDPPRSLEPAEATQWREIVASLPADFFANYSLQILLERLCVHAAEANHISKLIATCSKKNKSDREYVQLVKMHLQEVDLIMRLSKALGFFRPSMFNQGQSQRPGPSPVFRPWDMKQ
jgi:hypothetical protein